jgi:O-antigen ligase
MLTGSRAGAVVSLAGIFAAVLLLLRRELRSRHRVLWIGLPIAAGTWLGYLVLGGQVRERLGEAGVSGGGRWETYVSTVHMIFDHPLVGTGLGTFAYIFPRYRSGDVSIWGIWDRAHNTLLELTAELGIPLAVVVTVGWILALLFMSRGALRRRRGAIFPIAGLICSSIAIIHSMLDFSLQIPGFSITAMALMGMGLAQSEGERAENDLIHEPARGKRNGPACGQGP